MIRELIFSEFIHVYHIERYRHRLSIEGEPLYYYAIAGRKNMDVSQEFLESNGIIAAMQQRNTKQPIVGSTGNVVF